MLEIKTDNIDLNTLVKIINFNDIVRWVEVTWGDHNGELRAKRYADWFTKQGYFVFDIRDVYDEISTIKQNKNAIQECNTALLKQLKSLNRYIAKLKIDSGMDKLEKENKKLKKQIKELQNVCKD